MTNSVLILEDDYFLREDLADIVREQFAVEPVISWSNEQALRLITSEIKLALLDIEVVDGLSFSVARALQQKGVPFAFVSGSNPSSLPEDLQYVPFIQKPAAAKAIRDISNSLSGGDWKSQSL